MKNKHIWRAVIIAGVIALLIAMINPSCSAQSFTQIGSYPFVVTDLDFDEDGNIYVAKQNGIVYRNSDTLLSIPVWNQNEMGLVGLEVLNEDIYMHVSGLDTMQRIIRYDTNTQTFDTLLEVDYHTPFNTNHRGGDVVISDSILFCSFGYGADQSSPQDLDDYRGKLVTIDLETGSVGILGFGLRNPYRFDIDQEYQWGYIGDVGSNVAEEANYFDYWTDTLLNYGWPCWEGDAQLLDPDTLCDEYEYTWPAYFYKQPQPRTIIGGAFWEHNWYFCDHYSGVGGYMDSMMFYNPMPIAMGDTLPLKFPQYVTGMAVNPAIDRLVVSTWAGQIYVLETDSIVLAIPDDWDKPKTRYKKRFNEDGPTIYVDILGRKWMYMPYDIIFYDPHISGLRYINTKQ